MFTIHQFIAYVKSKGLHIGDLYETAHCFMATITRGEPNLSDFTQVIGHTVRLYKYDIHNETITGGFFSASLIRRDKRITQTIESYE